MELNKGKEVFEWLVCILIALIIVAIIKSFVGFPTVVSGESMDSTLKNGQRLWISRIGIEINKYPERGDIITFEAPEQNHLYQSKVEADLNNPVAKYNENTKNIFQKAISAISLFGKTDFIKRVIGLPGDHIEIKDNSVYRNGEKLNEPYLDAGTQTTAEGGMFTDIIVPDGYVYVLGDNRENSSDSRRFGCIPIEKIEGKAVWRFWPLNKWKVIKN
ncbi:MAG: signal peptidase I [Clostridia bacterium]|nr:signal peptidase I [Clostridia bacterium]